MKKTDMNETKALSGQARAQLDAMFASAAAKEPGPSDDLMARVLRDAQAVQADFGLADPERAGSVAAARAPRFWDRFFDGISAPARAVLAASVLAGVSFGYLGADTLSSLTTTVIDETGIDVLDDGFGDFSSDFAFMEG